MNIKILLTTIGLTFGTLAYSQDMTTYEVHVDNAEQLYDAKAYLKSAEAYKIAFDQIEGKAYPNDRYNAACSYALAGDIESAFFHLFRLTDSETVKYKNYNHIKSDTDLNSLHNDERWQKFVGKVKANKDEAEKYFDKLLVIKLEQIHEEDQKYRMQINEIQQKYGWSSDEMKAHWKLINEADAINQVKVEKILKTRGWLGPKVVGRDGSRTLFLVIQHADLKTQLKYLPMMRKALKEGNIEPSSMALLEDRVALRQGKKQIYGSQISRDPKTGEHYVLPIANAEHVDERRAEVGLSSLADYAGRWNIIWDVEKHNARSKALAESKK